MKFVLLALVFYLFTDGTRAQCEKDVEVVCYWGSWSIYRTETGYFNASNINTDVCTTLVYAFAGLDLKLEIASLDSNADIANGGFSNFIKLKDENPCLTTILAVGGWNEGSVKYSIMAKTEEGRKQFASSVVKFLAYYNFDGIDIDWEYPSTRGGLAEDGENFALLLKEIKSAISPWGFKLSIAVSIDDSFIGVGYQIAQIAESIDSVNLMAYDYISSSSPVTGLSAPLTEIKLTVSKWLQGGLPPKKLNLGIPAYAKSYVLKDAKNNGVGAPVSEIGSPGLFTNEAGLLAYFEVLDIFKYASDAVNVTIDDTKYAYYDDQWFTYDDEETISTKVKYAMEQKLGGIMFWAMELDDFKGVYGDRYPLLNAIKRGIKDYKSQTIKKAK